MILNPNSFIREKLGINYDTVRTAKHSSSFTPFFEWSEEEKSMVALRTNNYYKFFLEKVADGRGMSVDDVHEVAQGRIWTGTRALELGLVDALGDMQDAIDAAAQIAGLDEYKVYEYPKFQDPWTRFITELTEQSAQSTVDQYIDVKLRSQITHYDEFKDLISSKGPVARLPMIIEY